MTDTPNPPGGGIDYIQVQESEQFRKLRRTHRSFVFPLAVLFLIWYFVYVLLAAFAPEFMGTPLFGHITIGLVLGLGQFVTTFAITAAYVWYSNRKLDPQAVAIREDLERMEAGA